MPTLDWLNRAQAFTTAARVPYRLLKEVLVHTAAIRPGPAQAELVEALAHPPGGQRRVCNARQPADSGGMDMAAQIRASIQA